jgi:ATP-dependent DNA helicase RecG
MAFGASSGSYEQNKVTSASIDDLDQEALGDFIDRRAPGLLAQHTLEEAASRLGLVAASGTRSLPTVAGLYLFGVHPQWIQPQWGVAAVRLDGTELTDPVEAREAIEGPLPALVERALDFVHTHAREMIDQVSPEQSTMEFPMRAVREALVNALVHRDLRASGRVAVRIFEDRLEIWSPGSLPIQQAELDGLLERGGVSLPRNPLVAATARELDIGEGLGRGMPLLREVLAAEIHRKPVVHSDKHEVLVTLPSGRHTSPRAIGDFSN